ncbi:MAG TPA: right-handed parallel beta-helix repeat-containing protein [Desulfobacteraceae bacterium]|nr:right-handed parallel beta-helix repeat-containing protein [Desulfobacteraceae bacterium]
MGYNRIWYVLLVCMAGLLWSQQALGVVYVDKDRPAGGDGTSWAKAYNSLETAVADNQYDGAEFWIAEGTYMPSAPFILAGLSGNNPFFYFYGGFAGNETSPVQRDIAKHPVIIDGQGFLAHIFYATTAVDRARFDGLTIQRGAALGAKGEDTGQGGAILANQLSSVVITNCTFKNNKSNGFGGAVAVVNSLSVSIANSTFTGNESLQSAGGAIALFWGKGAQPKATIEKNYFEDNKAAIDGGAVYSGYYPLTLKDSTFVGNTSVRIAGAVKFDYNNNTVNRIERCIFLGNKVTGSGVGGALQVFAQSVVVENSVFAHNSSVDSGGAVGLHSGKDDPDPANYNPAMTATFTNCTFYGNAGLWGGALASIEVPTVNIHNSILWGNGANKGWFPGEPTNDYAIWGGDSVTIINSDIETLDWHHSWPEVPETHTNSFSADPLFFDPDGEDDLPGTRDDNLSITGGSPCTDSADGTYAPITDIVNRARTDNPVVANSGTGTPVFADIGAYEGPYTPPTPVPDGVNLIPIRYLLIK